MRTGKKFLTFILIAFILTACGRRGDPVLVEPLIQKDAGKQESKEQIPAEQTKTEQQTDVAAVPVVPTGLNGVYTQLGVILTWDYIDDQKIKYNIYRSEGAGFELSGESVTPVFTDRNVKAGVKYHYRVTAAVGSSEGPPSMEIIILMETN